jgi:hypothetical protein
VRKLDHLVWKMRLNGQGRFSRKATELRRCASFRKFSHIARHRSSQLTSDRFMAGIEQDERSQCHQSWDWVVTTKRSCAENDGKSNGPRFQWPVESQIDV